MTVADAIVNARYKFIPSLRARHTRTHLLSPTLTRFTISAPPLSPRRACRYRYSCAQTTPQVVGCSAILSLSLSLSLSLALSAPLSLPCSTLRDSSVHATPSRPSLSVRSLDLVVMGCVSVLCVYVVHVVAAASSATAIITRQRSRNKRLRSADAQWEQIVIL